MSISIFQSCVRAVGDLAGVFEHDGDTSYFYLYDSREEDQQKVISAIHVYTGIPDYGEGDVIVRWDNEEQYLGLFIRSELWAAFDIQMNERYGGNYLSGQKSDIPDGIKSHFKEA